MALARERKLPAELLDILDGLGIPPEKATYVCELDDRDWKEKGVLYEISWRVAGEVVKKPESNQNEGTPWGPPSWLRSCWLMLGHETCPVKPDFPAPHFDLDVSLYLPWVLDYTYIYSTPRTQRRPDPMVQETKRFLSYICLTVSSR